jgi:hypothetical protein
MLPLITLLPICCHCQHQFGSYAPLLEINHMTRKELAETTKDAVAVGLWTVLFTFTIMVGLVVWEGIVVF